MSDRTLATRIDENNAPDRFRGPDADPMPAHPKPFPWMKSERYAEQRADDEAAEIERQAGEADAAIAKLAPHKLEELQHQFVGQFLDTADRADRRMILHAATFTPADYDTWRQHILTHWRGFAFARLCARKESAPTTTGVEIDGRSK